MLKFLFWRRKMDEETKKPYFVKSDGFCSGIILLKELIIQKIAYFGAPYGTIPTQAAIKNPRK